MIASALALLLAAGPVHAYPPQGALAAATTGLVLAPAGALALAGLAAGGMATDPDGPALGLTPLAAATALPLLAAGPPLLAGGSLHAQSILSDRGQPAGGAMGWLSVALYVGAIAVPELMRTPDGDYGSVSDATLAWTRAALYAASYGAGVVQYVEVRRVWVPYQAGKEQRILEQRYRRPGGEAGEDRTQEEPQPEPPEPPNPEPPMPVAWTIAPVAMPGGGGGVALAGTF